MIDVMPIDLDALRRYAVARSLFAPTTLMRAIERLVQEKGLATGETLHRYQEAWHRAADRTPHGTPIELSPADFS